MKFPKESLEVINKLTQSGHKAYFVGGFLRDALMKKETGDIDLATSATPEEVLELFKEHRMLKTGIRHGTIVLFYQGKKMEITTFREEGRYLHHRWPEEVTFSKSIEEDVIRRDFTINALAYHPEEGLLDFVGGQEDLKKKLLRAVGSPKKRFEEDALRMMRLLRFASVLGFTVEEETKKALFSCKDLLKEVSAERIQVELSKLLMGEHVQRVLIDYQDVLAVIIPELKPLFGFEQQTPYHCYDVWIHTSYVVEKVKKELPYRLAALFHDIAKPQCFYLDDRGVGHFPGHGIASAKITEKILKRLRYSKKIQKKVLPMILHHNREIYPEELSIASRIFFWGEEAFFDVLELKWADNLAKEPAFIRSEKAYKEVREMAKKYLQEEPLLSYQDLKLSSHELMEMGYKEKAIANAQEKLALAVLGGLPNEKVSLVDYLEKNK